MNKQEQIKSYWQRINKLEERISELARKGLGFSRELKKRKSLLNEVYKLEKINTQKNTSKKK